MSAFYISSGLVLPHLCCKPIFEMINRVHTKRDIYNPSSQEELGAGQTLLRYPLSQGANDSPFFPC